MKTVLVVEDDRLNWRVFQRILTRLGGFIAKHTEDVEEILKIAQSGEADLILMDVNLPNCRYQNKAVNGIEITQLLKTNPIAARVPIIITTSDAIAGNLEDFLNHSNADGYIPKPVIDPQTFLAQIQATLQQHESPLCLH